MSFRTAARFAGRELRASWRNQLTGFRIFLACLILGVAAIAAVGSVRAAIEAGLQTNAARILGGDAEIELTYRYADAAERAWMQANATQMSEVVNFRSMAVVERGDVTERGLTQVKAVDDLYPLIGQATLSPDMPLDKALSGTDALPGAVMDRVLIDRLGLKSGDIFRLGTQDFVLSATLVQEPDSAGGFNFGPRTIVKTADLAGSGLLQPGTLFSTKYRLTVPEGTNLDALQTKAETDLTQGARWQDARNGAPGTTEFVQRLGAFLILIGLSGLAVGGVGVAAAVRSYISQKGEVIATLKTLGATRATIFQTYFIQIGILSIVGVIGGLILGASLPIIVAPWLAANLPVPAEFTFYPSVLAEAALYGLLTAIVFTLWPLAQSDHVRAAALFRDDMNRKSVRPRAIFLVAITIFLLALVTLAGWFSDNFRLTFWVAGGIAGALILLTIAAWGMSRLAHRLNLIGLSKGRSALRLALANIGGSRGEASAVVLSLGLGLSVLAAVGQIDGNLRNAISGNLPDVAPSYFFVDIQTDQMPGFMQRLETDPEVSRIETAPQLRGIITQINGRPASDIGGDHWVLEGDRGVTYAAAQPKGTTLTEGEWWAEDYPGPPLLSFSAQSGAEIGLKLGDMVTVNILGRDITAKITSFREVDFSNAGIGFILLMNEAALINAPHTHLATVYASEVAEAPILRDLASAYPNITAIRVRDAINRVADVLASIATATSYGALAALTTGFLVLIGAAAAGVDARTYEAAILKTLGATRATLLWSFALRSILLGSAAALVALGAGILGGWAVTYFVLETEFSVIWDNALVIIFGGVATTLIANLAFAARPLAARPASVLRAKG